MDVSLEDVPHVQRIGTAVFDDLVVVLVRCPAGGGVVVEDGVEDHGRHRGRVGDNVGHRGRPLVEDAVDLRLLRFTRHVVGREAIADVSMKCSSRGREEKSRVRI